MATRVCVYLLVVLVTLISVHATPVNHRTKQDKDTTSQDEDYWRVCYFTNWSQYRPAPATFLPENIDTSLCSHLIYAFSDMYENHLVFYEYNDDELFVRFNALKLQAPEIKTMLAVGGWTFGTSKMTLMISSQENRTEFINSTIDYLRHWGFDGLDLDFEYPASRGSPPEDKYLFTELCRELRAAFNLEAALTGRPKLLLTIGVPAGKSRIDPGYEIEKLAMEVDKILLMAYDLNGGFSNDTGINAPLYGDSTSSDPLDLELSVDFNAKYWVAGGCPPSKLVIGMALYGRGFTLENPQDNGIGAPVLGESNMLNYTGSKGFISWFELCRYVLPDPETTVVWDGVQRVPYAYRGDQWYGYDNKRSLREKVAWLKENSFSGWMVWAMDFDDHPGVFCGERYPLLNALNHELLGVSPPPVLTFCEDNGHTAGDFPDPADCNRFYRCTPGPVTSSFICPAGLLYNPVSRVCEYPTEIDQEYVCENCAHKHCNWATRDSKRHIRGNWRARKLAV